MTRHRVSVVVILLLLVGVLCILAWDAQASTIHLYLRSGFEWVY